MKTENPNPSGLTAKIHSFNGATAGRCCCAASGPSNSPVHLGKALRQQCPTSAKLALVTLLLALLPASAQTIFNGSFESNNFASGVGYASENGGVIAGWTSSNTNYTGLNTSAGPFTNNGAKLYRLKNQ